MFKSAFRFVMEPSNYSIYDDSENADTNDNGIKNSSFDISEFTKDVMEDDGFQHTYDSTVDTSFIRNELLSKEKSLELISRLCLMDNSLMVKVFEDNVEAVECMLKIILDREDIHVLNVDVEKAFINPTLEGKDVRLDILVEDFDGNRFVVEFQRKNDGADVHRARFYSSMADVKMLKKSQNFKLLKESYVIFITENDYIGAGMPIYHIDRMIKETQEVFDDGSHILYINGSYKNESTPLGKLIHDFWCTEANDMYYKPMADSVKIFKDEQKGNVNMRVDPVEEFALEIAQKYYDESNKRRIKKILQDGKLSFEDIAYCFDLPIEVVEELATTKK